MCISRPHSSCFIPIQGSFRETVRAIERLCRPCILNDRQQLKEEHKKILEQMHQVDKAESLILIATGSLVGEGFDFPRLDTLFMATPVSFRGVVEQYAGRLNRDYAGKENVIIYDYVDNHIPMFDKMYAKRLKAYKQIGYELACGLQIGKQTVNAIYDWDNYSTYYHKDLLGANNNIIISSPVISGPKVYELINLLKEKQMSGVQITIVTWAPIPIDLEMQHIGCSYMKTCVKQVFILKQ